jgi:FkbM family methyltransferase
MGFFARLAKRGISYTPYRVSRSAPNRFDAMASCLETLKRQGFRPGRVIDCGAHVGDFSRTASALFPAARIDLVDPQPAVRERLLALAAAHGFRFHPVGVSDRSGTARMVVSAGPDTGAHLAWPGQSIAGDQQAVDVEIATLDSLFATELSPSDRVLLKLDLQGHDLRALQGATRMLPFVEVLIVEVAVYLPGLPCVPEMIDFMTCHDFLFFDVAALSARRRDDRLRHCDLVFVRAGSALLLDVAWA